ncbi:hypothetical protein R1sor_025592 [Riccia sorocarpa]|uniref:CCHC-type domain-containing protein n=1 Tax=Riccia sorocarpa TaxID=122646 RepID=A0ABD3GB32_9MARC
MTSFSGPQVTVSDGDKTHDTTHTATPPNWADMVAGLHAKGQKQEWDEHMQEPIAVDWSENVQFDHVKDAFNELVLRNATKPGPNATRTKLDIDQATLALGMLQKSAVILFTAEEVPKRDKVVSWVQQFIVDNQALQVTAVREIARKHFLLFLGSQEQKEELMKNPPTRMYGKAIRLSPWNPSYNFKEAAKASKQIWLELQNIDPLLVSQGERMLQSLGQLLYHTVLSSEDMRYAHIRACVMRQDLDDLPESVIVDLPWGGHVVQEVTYTFLPDTCFRCRQRGHRVADCTQPEAANGPKHHNDSFRTPGKTRKREVPLRAFMPNPTRGTTPSQIPKGRPKTWHRVVNDNHQVNLTNRFSVLTDNLGTQPDNETSAPTELDHTSQHHHSVQTPTKSPRAGTNKTATSSETEIWDLNMAVLPLPADTSTEAAPRELQTDLELAQLDLTQPLTQPIRPWHDSPPDPCIVAKKRILSNREVSPHEEILQEREHCNGDRSLIIYDQTNLLPLPHPEDTPPLPPERSHDDLSDEQEGVVTTQTLSQVSIVPGAVMIIDFTASGRGCAALIVPPAFTVTSSCTSGIGNLAWAKIATEIGEVTVASLHAPNTKEGRTQLWENIYNLHHGTKWILAGDHNMVELWGDSRGKSAMISGAEARAWKAMAERNGLVDAYLYTLGAAPLGSDGIRSHTITIHCHLTRPSTETAKPKSYFKMDAALLKGQGVMDRVKQVWQNHPPDAGNPQRRWQQAWLRVKKILQQEREKQRAEHKNLHELRVELVHLRKMHNDDITDDQMARLTWIQDKVRKEEQDETRSWRIRSKDRWLREGEAPSRYFFAQMKSKFTRETMDRLELQDGNVTNDRKSILGEVEGFMTNLYTRQQQTQEISSARDEACAKLTRRISPNQDRRVAEKPNTAELDLIVKIMKKDKSPGLNLHKTTVIPMVDGHVPQWLLSSGCSVAAPSDRFRYLGLLTGMDIAEEELIHDLHQKYAKRLLHWSTKLLSWPEKVQLAHSVLRTLPNYMLMAIGMSKPAISTLEKISREFLWGTNTAGRSKKPLIAWSTLTKKKYHGGLGWPSMQQTAEAFLLKNVTKIIQANQEDWVQVAEAIVAHTVQHSSRSTEIKSWSVQELLLGSSALRIPLSPTLNRMLGIWFKIKDKLTWVPECGTHPTAATPRFIHALLIKTETVDEEEGRALLSLSLLQSKDSQHRQTSRLARQHRLPTKFLHDSRD